LYAVNFFHKAQEVNTSKGGHHIHLCARFVSEATEQNSVNSGLKIYNKSCNANLVFICTGPM